MKFRLGSPAASVCSTSLHFTGLVDLSRKLLAAASVAALGLVALSQLAWGQTPVVFPNTISTVGGGGSLPANGAACSTSSSYTATDAFGDGCPANLVSLGTSQWGIGVDKFGNIFWLDNGNKVIHKIDARSGIMTKVAGGISSYGCTGQTSPYGDNCVAALNFGGFNARGMTVDPWGNVILADYGNGLVHIVCNTVSPLCSLAQIGYAEVVAGYVKNSTTAGGNVSGTTAGTAGDGTAGFSSVSTTGVNGPRGAAADVYGNVYVADTGNGRYRVVLGPAVFKGVTNPLYAVIQTDSAYSTAVAGNIYPIEGGFTAVTKNNFCNGSSGAVSLDAYGDGCPFFRTSGSGGTSSLYGVTADAAGDVIFPDSGLKLVRVLYAGGSQMAALITLENPGVTPVIGSVYAIAGGGTVGISATPLLATTQIWNSAPNSVTLDAAGNIYVADTATGEVMFIDINTGHARVLFNKAGTPCAGKTDSIGDGCPASQSTFGGETYILPIALDNLGNLFLADGTDNRIRKVSAGSLMPMTVASGASQTILLHEPAGVTGITVALALPSPDVTVAGGTCTTNGDMTLDCPITATLSPTSPGVRAAALVVTPSGSLTTPAVFPLAGLSTGSALVGDGVTSSTSGSVLPIATLGSLTPLTVAVDGSNNVYSVNSSNLDFSVGLAGSSVSTLLSSTAPAGVSQMAVDTQGNVYAVGSGAATITKLTVTSQGSATVPPTYSAGTVSYMPPTTPAKPQGIAVDSNNNIYVSDGSNGAVYKFSQSSTTQPLVTAATGFTNPTLLALDNSDNLYVYDAGAGKVLKITYLGVQTIVATVAATGLATDAAGDVYVQSAAGVTEYPASGAASVSVYGGGTTPNGIAVAGNGTLYLSDAANTGILQILRTAISYNFGTGSNGSPTLTGTLTDAGNQAATGSSNLSNFSMTAGSSNGCTFNAGVLAGQAIGNACTFTANFVGTGSGSVNNIFSYLPASTVGSLSLSGTLTGQSIATTTTISAPSPSNPLYSPSAAEVSFTVTVAAQSGGSPPTSNVTITVDSGAPANYPLTPIGSSNPQGATATVALSGLTATNHTISATYPTTGSFTASSYSGNPVAFSVGQDTTAASWTPGVTSLPYSSAIGAAALNATATFNGATVPGVFVYTANGNEINAASYLPVGTYTLNATFYPIDTTDYTTALVSGGTLTVTKATTTAAVGATQNLVASDGTGNYANVQAAINALPATGGSVYIKPGTYTGFLTVVQPNVALRGLGGDPTQVILTHEAGAFGSSYPYTGEFTVANMSNGDQLPGGSTVSTGDAGSATLFVARGVNTAVSATTLRPNSFYAENLR